MIFEDLRHVHEDLERLEEAMAERLAEEPKHIRNRLMRDHEVAAFLARLQDQSQRALSLYADKEERTNELQKLGTGDPFSGFYAELQQIRDFHRLHPHEPVENTERAYKKVDDNASHFIGNVDAMFTGEESYGRYFDLTVLHEEYSNLPGIKQVKIIAYLKYLEIFDEFVPPHCTLGRKQKMTDEYFSYVGSLADYLQSFMRRIKPLEDLQKLFKEFDDEFAKAWEEDKVVGWEIRAVQSNDTSQDTPMTEGTGAGIWCADCEKEFGNNNVYKSHLTGKKHIKNVTAREQAAKSAASDTNGHADNPKSEAKALKRTKERAIAEREHRVRKLAAAMSTIREDTRTNVERRAGMTDRERQQEIELLYQEDTTEVGREESDDELDTNEEKLYNPLKLPLAWDGKPIPFWLYKLHGLGVEFSCEICGNFVYMGRRAFDKHFSESRHIYGLSCLGIDKSTNLFREITKIEEAEKLWNKIQRDKAKELELKGGENGRDIEEVEDMGGNVMPVRVYEDLVKAIPNYR